MCRVGIGQCLRQVPLLCVGGALICPAVAGAPTLEVCDGRDNDCDGFTDESFVEQGQTCSVGVGACVRQAQWQCLPSGLRCPASPGVPTAEVCNTMDDNCDGLTDNVDADSDSHFPCPYWSQTLSYDCADDDSSVYPGAAELCDGKDNDCDLSTPDGLNDPRLLVSCDGADSDACLDDDASCADGLIACSVGDDDREGRTVIGSCTDGVDNDCDGVQDLADEDCWWDHSYAHRVRLRFDNAARTIDLDGFPVLVVLSDATISGLNHATHFLSGGADARFVDSDDATVLPHQVERWDSGGVSHLWTRVPRIDPGSTSDHIWLYFGRAGDPGAEDPAAVWDARYRAVWHLTGLDDSAGSNDLSGTGTTSATGTIGAALAFNGTNASAVSTAAIGIAGASARTITFWARAATTQRGAMVGWGSNANSAEFRACIRDNKLLLWSWQDGDWDTGVTPPTAAWQFHAITYDGAIARWYVNDAELGSGHSHTYNTTNSAVTLAYEYDLGSTSWYNGGLDEVRIVDQVLPRQWITAQYAAQRDALILYGSIESW